LRSRPRPPSPSRAIEFIHHKISRRVAGAAQFRFSR
jgi:hypothetical protein